MALGQRTLRLVPRTGDWKSPTQIMHDSIAECIVKGRDPRFEWMRRHMMAWELSDAGESTGKMKLEATVRDLVIAWARHGEAHRIVHGTNIGEDQYLGFAWKAQAQALLMMLNGELGRLDGGTLDKIIRAVAETCGVDLEV
jgi:hypothetical protein